MYIIKYILAPFFVCYITYVTYGMLDFVKF